MIPTMTTEVAQRHLLEALASLAKRECGIAGLLLGLPIAIDLANVSDMPELAGVYVALGEVAAAVGSDVKEHSNG